ncbi:MAG: acyl-CoA dehydrogenase family protein [Desertimonas sp.]
MSDLDTNGFDERVVEFLDANAERLPADTERVWGQGPDDVSSMGNDSADSRRAAQEWRARLYDAGFGWISGPSVFGGAGLDPYYDERFAELAGGYDVPEQGIFQVSRGMVSPAIVEHGSDALKERFLPAIHRGEIICCQLLSEPEAGSDLGGLRTTAVRDGDEWVVNGQKVWSSYAHVADYGQLLARTDQSVPKHQGLTMFMLPMDTPGVEVRPLRQMTGEAHFNEVFFDDVRVPDALRVGEPGTGWRAVLTTLMNERHVVANRGRSAQSDAPTRLRELAVAVGRNTDARIRQRLAEVYTVDRVLQYMRLREEAAAAAGKAPGPEGSIGKLLHTGNLRRIGDLAGELLGASITADSGAWGTYAWSQFLCGSPGLRIAGGTDAIQRNTLGERALGLPKEPR